MVEDDFSNLNADISSYLFGSYVNNGGSQLTRRRAISIWFMRSLKILIASSEPSYCSH